MEPLRIVLQTAPGGSAGPSSLAEWLGLTLQLLAIAVSVVALIRTRRSEERNQEQLQRQEEENQKRFRQQEEVSQRRFQLQEERNQQRFEEQLMQSSRIAAAHLRPLLALETEAHGDRKSLTLCNYGAGPSLITWLDWRRETDSGQVIASSHDLGKLVDMEGLPFEQLSDFNRSHYVAAKDSEVVIKLTKEALLSQGGRSHEEADRILRKLEEIIDEITLEVTYEDVLGNVIAERARLV